MSWQECLRADTDAVSEPEPELAPEVPACVAEAEAELEELRASEFEFKDLCVVCMDAKKEYAVLPCGHVCLCAQCAEAVRCTQTPRCPMCQVPMVGEGVMKLYF